MCIYFYSFASGDGWINVGNLPTEYAPVNNIVICTYVPSNGAYILVNSNGALQTCRSSDGKAHIGAITYIITL